MSNTPLYLPNLNGVRFIAALTVIVAHVDLTRLMLGFSEGKNSVLGVYAGFGVDFFFALSGFLITYLLVQEEARWGRIHIRDFYIRRIFRIWPLYFLVLAAGTALELGFHEQSSLLSEFNWSRLALYAAVLPQVGKAFFIGSLCVAVLWSIGVEELFYLFFPWLFRWFRGFRLRGIMLTIGTLLVFKVVGIYLLFKFGGEVGTGIIKTMSTTRFENLLIGAAAALFLVANKQILLRSRWPLYVSLFCVVALTVSSALKVNIYFSQSIGPILQTAVTPFLVSFFVSVILCFLAFDPRFATLFENSVMNHLGKVSYGLYVYHCLVLTMISLVPMGAVVLSSWGGTLVVTVVLTVTVASISYKFFEKPFLNRSSGYRHI
jgi:peptidoglycan/LPS O-acetylase OafA/YrhL